MSTTEVVIKDVYYGIPNGNYDGSSMDWASDGVQAVDYYKGHGSLQSVRYQLSGVVARIYVEGTLDSDPENANWFTTIVIGDGINPLNIYRSDSIVGNFTWARVRVEAFSAGLINQITLTY
jgi:hypothetical protein